MNSQNNNGNCRCRLCHSEFNLIPMFKNGKNNPKKITDYFRMVIWIMIGIEIEPIDQATSVCFECLLDLHNFYYFKFTCLEKQKLKQKENETVVSERAKKPKLDYTSVRNFPKPNMEQLDDIFSWLDSKGAKKLKTVEDKSSQISNVTLDAFTQSELEPLTNHQNNSSQTDEYHSNKLKKSNTKNRKIQTFFRGKEVSTQCALPEIRIETVDQTTGIAAVPAITSEPVKLDCDHKLDKQCQTESESFLGMLSDNKLNKSIQTNSAQKSISVQCDLSNVSQVTRRSLRKTRQSNDSIVKIEKNSCFEIPISKSSVVDSPLFDSNLVILKREPTVHVCNFCYEQFESKREFGMHCRRHCKMCKILFTTVKQVEVHGKTCSRSCPLKELYIEVVRVEQIPGIKEKYPNSFL